MVMGRFGNNYRIVNHGVLIDAHSDRTAYFSMWHEGVLMRY